MGDSTWLVCALFASSCGAVHPALSSAIALGGLGGGFEIGVEITDMVIVLNSKRALQSFSKGGML